MKSAAIRKLRKRLGMTQGELARVCGVAPNTVWRWESGWPITQRTERTLRLLESSQQAVVPDNQEE